MKKVYFFSGFFFFLIIYSLSAAAQKPLDSLFSKLDTKYPQEKIYIQYDKSFYNPGNTVWFKAYLTADNDASHISNTLYAELTDAQGRIVERKIIPILESGAASSFDIPQKLSSDKLYVRAYTSWMQNFDSSLFYLQPLAVVLPKTAATKEANSYSITFFPEGGDLIKGLSSNVAFKATDKYGIPCEVSGIIKDGTGKKAAVFSSVHDGMGMFELLPVAGEKYTAVWKDKTGKEITTPLPDVKDNGVAFSVSAADSSLSYTVRRTPDAPDAFKELTVFAQMHNRMAYMAKIKLQKNETVTAPIRTADMPDGILQLTVFNADMVPVAERIVFVNNAQYSFPTDLHLVEKNVTKRGHNVLQVDVGGTLKGNLSVAITDADINVAGKDEKNIYSHLLLTSDLKGSVYNSAYYFSDDAAVRQNTDLVMMTNGWRRFRWQEIVADKWPALTHLSGEYAPIYGNIYGISKGQLAGRSLTAFLKTSEKRTDFITIPINDDGSFYDGNFWFFDTARVYYQLSNDKDKSLTDRATINFGKRTEAGPGSPVVLYPSLLPATVPDSISSGKSMAYTDLSNAQQKDAFNKEKTLETVTLQTKTKTAKEKINDEYASGLFNGGDDMIFLPEEDPSSKGALDVLQYLQSRVGGMQINTSGDGSVTWRGQATSIFLDQNTTDISMIRSISMQDVAMIKIFRPPFFGASGGGAGGAIAVYTKKGSSRSSGGAGLSSATIYGYSAFKDFYSPDYSKPSADANPDVRTTLLWQPYVLLDKKTRRATIPFYNSDNCKRIKIIVEGLNELGQLTREEKIFVQD